MTKTVSGATIVPVCGTYPNWNQCWKR